MSETTAEYQVKAKSGIMNNNTRNEFAAYGLEILKRSVLLVLYEDTDVVSPDPPGRSLKQGEIRVKLGIRSPRVFGDNVNSLIMGVLLDLRTDELAHHYFGIGWAITQKGVSLIEGS